MVRRTHLYMGTYKIYKPEVHNDIFASVQLKTPLNYIIATSNGQLYNDLFARAFRIVH